MRGQIAKYSEMVVNALDKRVMKIKSWLSMV